MVAASLLKLHNDERYFLLLLCQRCFLLLWSVYLKSANMIYAENYFHFKRHLRNFFVGTISLLNFALVCGSAVRMSSLGLHYLHFLSFVPL